MSSLERRPGRTLFTRPGQTPGLHEGVYHASLLITGLCSLLMLVVQPIIAVIVSMLAGVTTMSMGLVALSTRVASGGRLISVRRHFELSAPAVAEGYRDAPHEDELLVEGRRFPRSKVREVVLGHYSNTAGGSENHFYPVYLVLENHVIELAVLRRKRAARRLCREIAELFDVPVRRRETGLLGTGTSVGCVQGLITIGLELAALMVPLLVLSTLGPLIALPTPALMALALWLINRMSASVFGSSLRKRIDEQVVHMFELGPRVRVEAPEVEALDAVALDAREELQTREAEG